MFRVLLMLLLLAPSAIAATRPFLRAGVSVGQTDDTVVRDRDCSSTAPPALFGCVDGLDGRALGAYGDFGTDPGFEIAAGIEMSDSMRLEVAVGRQTLSLDASANFVGVDGEQPVQGDGTAWSAIAGAALDLGPRAWRVRPFISAGAGVARNELDGAVYSFPGIAPDAVTILSGGTSTAFAWNAGAGAAIAISPGLLLDVALRYSDLGDVRTDAGAATIVRPRGTFEIEIDGTRAPLRKREVAVSLRWRK
jgi:opacity protein-like surface antigen